MRFAEPTKIFDNIAANASINSKVLELKQFYGVCLVMNFTAAIPNGDMILQVSNDGLVWADLSTLNVTAIGSEVINFDAIHAVFCRFRWADNASAGGSLIDAHYTAKG